MDRLIGEHGAGLPTRLATASWRSSRAWWTRFKRAVEVQEALRTANEALPEDRQVRFRIGVHVGDVMVKGGDLFGDGVNIAARLQALAEPGGVCISGAAHEHVRKALPFTYQDLGSTAGQEHRGAGPGLSLFGAVGARTARSASLQRLQDHSRFPTSPRSPCCPSPT